MSRARVSRRLGVALVLFVLVAPALGVVAQTGELVDQNTGLSYYPPAETEGAKKVEDLFWLVTYIAIFVFVVVEALLLYVVFRFRKNRITSSNETERGHTKAEIAWTIVPALILIFIGLSSVGAMQYLDRVPEDVDGTVRVEGFQWGWNFKYEGAADDSNLHVQAGSKIKLEVTSKDVIHAIWIPDFAVKLDAVPGHVNVIWFDAPAEPGIYFAQCAEYCYTDPNADGIGHHSMHTRVFVHPASVQLPGCGGKCGKPLEGTQFVNAVDIVSGNLFAQSNITIPAGATVTWSNKDPNAPHTVTPYAASEAGWGSKGSAFLVNGQTYTNTFPAPGTYNYRCVPHSQGSDAAGWTGMTGVVRVLSQAEYDAEKAAAPAGTT